MPIVIMVRTMMIKELKLYLESKYIAILHLYNIGPCNCIA